MDDSKALKGNITISRPSYSDGRKCVSIEVVDESSRVQFVEIEIDLENFAEAITGLGHTDCRFELRRPELVGMESQNKEEFVPDKASLKTFEIDGWKAREGDRRNGHRASERDGVWGHTVVFFRHVARKP